MIINLVVILVPNYMFFFGKSKKVKIIQWFSKKAIRVSFKKNNFLFQHLSKNNRGIPIYSNVCFWSSSHKKKYVGGVIAIIPIGIDIEDKNSKIRSKIKHVFLNFFFRYYWVAKEAVLKAEIKNISKFSYCRVYDFDEFKTIIYFDFNVWHVMYSYFNDYVMALAINNFEIGYCLME